MKTSVDRRLAIWVALTCLVAGSYAVQQLRGRYGTFSSPNYPQVYANDLDKTWQITVRAGYRIKVRFTSFNLEDSYIAGRGPCIYDYVLIMEGAREIKRFCGNQQHNSLDAPRPNDWFYTEGNSATVRFVSDYSNEDITPTGFRAHYIEEDIDECAVMIIRKLYKFVDWDELLKCDHYCNNVPGSFYCSCKSGYRLHADKHTCIATFCENQQLRADAGFVEIPGYPRHYTKYANCSWHIRVRDGMSVQLTFLDPFAVEGHVDEGCANDKLKIAYGDVEKEYCGDEVPSDGQVIDMNTRDVTITFTSDRSVEMAGFKIKYVATRIRCLAPLSAPTNGRISPNPKGYYEFEDMVTFNCIRGHEFSPGSKQRLQCLSNGQWNHPQPKCQIKVCGRPEHLTAVSYSSIVDLTTKRFHYGERVTVKCDSWYEMIVGFATWRCEDNKQWVGDSGRLSDGVPKCRPKCGARMVGLLEDRIFVQLPGAKRVTNLDGWPWMVFVDVGGGRKGNKYYCGGTLVDEMTVVTAAHCLDSTDIDEDIIVWLGLLDRFYDNFNYTQSFTVSYDKRFSHPRYRDSSQPIDHSFDSDIAVLKLDRPVNLSYYVHPICLPGERQEAMITDYKKRGKNSVLIGWGENEIGHHSQHLMKTRVPFVDTEECREKYARRFPPDGGTMITKNMICAGFDHGRNDACQGDAGSPLMTKVDAEEKWYLNGVVSFGEAKVCGKSGTYSVYTDVGKTAGFLRKHMEK